MNNSPKEFPAQSNDEQLRDDLRQLVHLAIREDIARDFDLTTVAIVPPGVQASACIVARSTGIACGIDLIQEILSCLEVNVRCETLVADGSSFQEHTAVAKLSGDARDLLTAERTVLNFLGRLCGISTWTHEHTQLIADTAAGLYDTRKTTPGWRRLEKYAVRCGGGRNHRLGLSEAILIKDNHLACQAAQTGKLLSTDQAVQQAREFVQQQPELSDETIVEIEVDSLTQLQTALPAGPDIVLLDNMDCQQLQAAVAMRDATNPRVQLEASGSVNRQTLRDIALTGVDRISMGALTHSAINLDLGLDWQISPN